MSYILDTVIHRYTPITTVDKQCYGSPALQRPREKSDMIALRLSQCRNSSRRHRTTAATTTAQATATTAAGPLEQKPLRAERGGSE